MAEKISDEEFEPVALGYWTVTYLNGNKQTIWIHQTEDAERDPRVDDSAGAIRFHWYNGRVRIFSYSGTLGAEYIPIGMEPL